MELLKQDKNLFHGKKWRKFKVDNTMITMENILAVLQAMVIVLKSLIIPFFLSFIIYSLLMITAQKREKRNKIYKN